MAEKLGIRSVSVTFQQLTLPSPDRAPLAYPGRPFPPDITDNRVLWELDAESNNVLFGTALNTNRATIGLPPVDDVRDYVIGTPAVARDRPDPGPVAGTTTTATRAGSPQVVVPQAADQPYWAARIAELGIGVAHDGPTPTVESLSSALKTALTQETRARATAVAGVVRTDGAAVAAKLLLDWSC